MVNPIPPQTIPQPGNFTTLVVNLDQTGIGEIDLYSVPPPVNSPRFKLLYNMTGSTPVFLLTKYDPISGAQLGAPVQSGMGTSTFTFYIDICGSNLTLYAHHMNPIFGYPDILGTFTDPDFATITAIGGIATTVFSPSENPQCAPLPPAPFPVSCGGCRNRCCGVDIWSVLCC